MAIVTESFGFTGTSQQFTVALASGASTDVDVLIEGGGGGGGSFRATSTGGHGQRVEFTIPNVFDGAVITIEVGGGGGVDTGAQTGLFRTYPDGGKTQVSSASQVRTGAGGGSTRIYLNGVLVGVAGAGGGSGGHGGGNAGFPEGEKRTNSNGFGGGGGTQTEGGAANRGVPGDIWWGDYLHGGDGNFSEPTITGRPLPGGGGGGGYYGAGGGITPSGSTGQYPPGGGGSSWTDYAGATYTVLANGGATNTAGGAGSATITYDDAGVNVGVLREPFGPTVSPPLASSVIDGILTFGPTGEVKTLTIAEDSYVIATLIGAGGGGGVFTSGTQGTDRGGHGGLTEVEFIALAGTVLEFWVGERGYAQHSINDGGGVGGWPDGGDAGNTTLSGILCGGGGGSTRLLADSVLLAVAGGGGGGTACGSGRQGGDGGGLEGGDAVGPSVESTGGTQTEGGTNPQRSTDPNVTGGQFRGGNGYPNTVVSRMAGTTFCGGGGGGGYWGGGGGSNTNVRSYPRAGAGSGFLSPDLVKGSTTLGAGGLGGFGSRAIGGAEDGQDGELLLKIEPIAGGGVAFIDVTTLPVVTVNAPDGGSGQVGEVLIDQAKAPTSVTIIAPKPPVFAIGEPLVPVEVIGEIGGQGNISATVFAELSQFPVNVFPPAAQGVSGGNTNQAYAPIVVQVGAPQFILASTVDVDQLPSVVLSAAGGYAEAAIDYNLAAPLLGPTMVPVEGSAVSIASYDFSQPLQVAVVSQDGFSTQTGDFEFAAPFVVQAVAPAAFAEEIDYIEPVPFANAVAVAPPEAVAGGTFGYILSRPITLTVDAPKADVGAGYTFDVNQAFGIVRTSPPDVILQMSARLIFGLLVEMQVSFGGGEAFQSIPAFASNELLQVDVVPSDPAELSAGAEFTTLADDPGLVVDLISQLGSSDGSHNALSEGWQVEVIGDIGGLGTVSSNVLTPVAVYDIDLTAPTAVAGGAAGFETPARPITRPIRTFAAQSTFAVSVDVDPFFDDVVVTVPEGEGVLALEAPGQPFAYDITLTTVEADVSSIADFEVALPVLAQVKVNAPEGDGEIAGSFDATDILVIMLSPVTGEAEDGLNFFDTTVKGPILIEEVLGSAQGDARFNVIRTSDFGGHWRVNLVVPLNPGLIDQVDGFATAGVNVADALFAAADPVVVSPPEGITQKTATVFVNFIPQIEVEIPEAFTHEDVIDAMLPLSAVKVRAPDAYATVDVAGFSPLRYLRSMTAGAVPTALALREIALNEMDGRVFWNDGVSIRGSDLGALAAFGLAPEGGNEGNVLRGDRTWGVPLPQFNGPVRFLPSLGDRIFLSEAGFAEELITPEIGTIYYRPFFLSRQANVATLGVDVDTGAAGSTVFAAVTRWNVVAQTPGETLIETSFDTATAGEKNFATNDLIIQAGWYAAVFVVNGSTAPILTAERAPSKVDDTFTTVGDPVASYAGTLDPAPDPTGSAADAFAFVQGSIL